jgi:hypothetical protein
MPAKSLWYALAFLSAILASLFLFFRWPAQSSASSDRNAASFKQPVIVELFTSEGCSSCPPADSILKKLSEDQPFNGIEILALEEHVDYWNTLGWSDPFSSADFSRRQEQYAVALPDGGIYTPQMVIDGAAQFVGNRTHESRDQIRWAAAHPKSRLLLTPLPASSPYTRTFELRLNNTASSALDSSPLELWIAVTEKNLRSNVTAGENSGHTLQHAPLVRLLRKQQSFNPPFTAPFTFSLNLNENWLPANLTLIAFLSNPNSHQIMAAGSSPM